MAENLRKRRLYFMRGRQQFAEIGFSLMSDCLDIHLMYWTFSFWLGEVD